jgi:hypothetical protein
MSTSSTAHDNTDLILGFEKLFPSLHSLLSIHNAAKRDGISLVYTDEELSSALVIGRKAEAEVHALRELIQKLAQQSASCEEALKAHSSAMAPMNRVPTEILERILLATLGIPNSGEDALSLDTQFEYSNAICTDAGVWALRKVCRRWRTLVDSSPRMWTCFHLEFNSIVCPSLDVVQAYLKRSGTLPLDISFHVDKESHLASLLRENLWRSGTEIFLAVCVQAFRWRTANIRIHEVDVPYVLSLVMDLESLVLLRLAVDRLHSSEDGDVLKLPASWTHLPCIQFLDLEESCSMLNEGSFWNIRQLALCPCWEHVTLLNLSKLTSLAFLSGEATLTLRPVELPALRALDLTQTSLYWVSRLCLVTKSLTSLAAAINKPPDFITLSKIISSFQCYNLSKLVIRFMNHNVIASDYGDLSKLFGSCRCLEIVCMSIHDRTLYARKPSAVMLNIVGIWKLFNRQQHFYLPKLKHLDFCLEIPLGSPKPIAAPAELLDMMESRAHNAISNSLLAATSPTEDGGLLPLECVTWRSAMSLSFSDTDQEHLNLLRQRGLRYESFIMNPHEPWRLEGFYI